MQSLRRFRRAAALIAGHDIAFMLRQRETLLWVFVMPVVFFYFIGTVTGGFGAPAREEAPDPLGVLAADDAGYLAEELILRLRDENFDVHRVRTPQQLAAYDRRLRLPQPPAPYASFTEALLAGETQELRFGRDGDDPGARFDQLRVARAVYGLLADLAVLVAEEPGTEPVSPEALRELADEPRSVSLRVQPAGRRVVPPSGYEQAVPGITVMFTMLVLFTSGSVLLVIERQHGLLRRLAATPISRGAIVAGKLGGRLTLGLVQIGFGMATGSVLFGVRWGAALPMVMVVMLAWACLTAGLGLLAGNLARTEGQVVGLGVLATNVLAALGGCWWPIEVTPDWMQGLAMALPTGWAMDALHKLVNFGYGPMAALPHVAALLVAALLVTVAAARTFRYE